MDTEVKSLANIKAMEGRNLDASVNGNTLVSGEKADGTFGVFNFFQGIKNFFKGISALGTLASGSRLPVTDSNGNVTYTTMNDINSYVINNALANYNNLNFIGTDYVKSNLNDIKTSGSYRVGSEAVSKPYNTAGFMTVYKRADNLITQIFIGDNSLMAIRCFSTTWTSWEKLTTESDLTNYQPRTFADGITSTKPYTFTLNNYRPSLVMGFCQGIGSVAILLCRDGSNLNVINMKTSTAFSSRYLTFTLSGDTVTIATPETTSGSSLSILNF